MNKLKKSLLFTGALVSVGAAATTAVSAATDTSTSESLVEKIATKFNLNQDEVQAVFDEAHAEREAEHQQRISDKLDDAVADGDLTQEQADKLKAKIAELHESREAKREEFEAMTHEERHDAMEAAHVELEQWLEDNDIPGEYAHFLRMGGRGHGHGPGGHHGGFDDMEDDTED